MHSNDVLMPVVQFLTFLDASSYLCKYARKSMGRSVAKAEISHRDFDFDFFSLIF